MCAHLAGTHTAIRSRADLEPWSLLGPPLWSSRVLRALPVLTRADAQFFGYLDAALVKWQRANARWGKGKRRDTEQTRKCDSACS